MFMMLKKDLVNQMMNSIDYCLLEKIKKVIGLIKYELRGKIMMEFGALRPKTYSYIMDDGNSNKKAKGKNMCNKTKT